MEIVTAMSANKDFKKNVKSVADKLKLELSEDPHVVFVFVSRFFIDYAAGLPDEMRKYFPDCKILGCTGSVLMTDDHEEGFKPCISVMGCYFPKTNIEISHLDIENRPGMDDSPADWLEFAGIVKNPGQSFIIFADPFTADIDQTLQGLDYAYNCPITGGFSSGTQFKGEVCLYAGDKSVHSGIVVLSLSGKVDVVPLVAQGCRPIGDNLTVTECDNIVINKVDEKAPMEYLQLLANQLNDEDRMLMQKSLFLGVEMDLMKADLSHGDYLIRNIRGVSPEDGALVIGEQIQINQSVRFHIRDPKSSRSELECISKRMKTKLSNRNCKGILLFSCLGRVSEFYNEEGVDASIIRQEFDSAPLSGFFCSGEIGQVSGSTYIHGYTASALLFYEAGK